MNFVFNFTALKETPYTKEAEEVVNRALNKLDNSHIPSDRINRIVFYYNYSSNKNATISIVFEEVEKKVGLVINQIAYLEEFDNKDHSLKIFQTITDALNLSGYKVTQKNFFYHPRLKKTAQIVL